jgi:hypothetical protein
MAGSKFFNHEPHLMTVERRQRNRAVMCRPNLCARPITQAVGADTLALAAAMLLPSQASPKLIPKEWPPPGFGIA